MRILFFILGELSLKVQKCYHKIIKNLGSTDEVVDILIEQEVLTIGDSQEIRALKTTNDKNRKLLEKLRSEEDFKAFLQSLEINAVETELSQEIQSTTVSIQERERSYEGICF